MKFFHTIKFKFIGSVAFIMLVLVLLMFGVYSRSIEDLGYRQEIQRARDLLVFSEELRGAMTNLNANNAINREELLKEHGEQIANGKAYSETTLYKTIPVVFSWMAIKDKAEEMNLKFRVPKTNPRNPINEPRPGLEKAVVEYLEGKGPLEAIEESGGDIVFPPNPDEARSLGEICVVHKGTERLNAAEGGKTEKINALRYFRSVKLTNDCLSCHGEPAGSRDFLGGIKEGWKAGEVHGAFQIISPLDGIESQIAAIGRWQSGVSGAALLLSAIFLGFLFNAYINRPIKTLTSRLREIANGRGDLTKDIPVTSKNEFGELSSWFNTFLAQMRGMVTNIRANSDHVLEGSEEIARASQDLASATTEQEANLQQTTEAIESLTQSIQDNSERVNGVDEITHSLTREAEKGGEAVTGTVEAMKQIADNISMIDEIADQTSLLAFNATIEAARAGDAGKGFSVVAVEIRKLAERCQQSAKTIQDLAGNSVRQADGAGRMIQNLVPSIREISRKMSDIRETCSSQSLGAGEILSAVGELRAATQQNSHTGEETAQTSEMLREKAAALRELIDQFKVDASKPDSPSTPGPQFRNHEPQETNQQDSWGIPEDSSRFPNLKNRWNSLA